MRLFVSFSTPVARADETSYVRRVLVEARGFEAESDTPYAVARLAIDQVLWDAARADGEPLEGVCDADSQGLSLAHHHLTGGGEDFRPDLLLDERITESVLLLHRVAFHPDVLRYRKGILDASLGVFGGQTLSVTWRATTGLGDADLADLGFMRIAGSELVFRHESDRRPFGESHPQGQEIEFLATPEHHKWVEDNWAGAEV
jgi:hypothetical protein